MQSRSGTVETARPRLAKNYVLLTVGECVAKAMAFIAFTYLGRTLGPERYGSLEFVLAAMVFFTLPVDLGLGDYGAREVARNRPAAPTLLDHVTSLRFVLAACSFCALLAFIVVAKQSTEVKALLALYGVSLFGAPGLLHWFFQSHDCMHWVAAASITRQTVFAALVLTLVRPGTQLSRVGVIECAAVAATVLVSLAAVTRGLGYRIPRPIAQLRELLVHIRQAAPIGLSELAWAFQWYFATVLLGFLAADRSLGWFGAAHRMVTSLHTFVWLYFFNLLPSIARSASLPHGRLLELMSRSMSVAAWSGAFVALLVTVLAQTLMVTAYGQQFVAAAGLLSILVWMIPVSMLSGHYRYTLIGYGRQKLLLLSVTASAAISVLLCFALIPWMGAVGAAFGLIGGSVANLALSYALVRRAVLRIPLQAHISQPALALALSAGLFAATARWNAWAAAGVAISGYLVLLWIWKRTDVVLLVKSLVERDA